MGRRRRHAHQVEPLPRQQVADLAAAARGVELGLEGRPGDGAERETLLQVDDAARDHVPGHRPGPLVPAVEIERRQVEQIERAIAREVDRRAEASALEFENRMRAIREEAADRLHGELDRTAESFLRRADGLIADQLQHAVDAAAQRLDDRILELAKRYESVRSPADV